MLTVTISIKILKLVTFQLNLTKLLIKVYFPLKSQCECRQTNKEFSLLGIYNGLGNHKKNYIHIKLTMVNLFFKICLPTMVDHVWYNVPTMGNLTFFNGFQEYCKYPVQKILCYKLINIVHYKCHHSQPLKYHLVQHSTSGQVKFYV